jgi:hypothetical protein
MAQLFWESNFNNARAGNVISSIPTVSHDKKVAFVMSCFRGCGCRWAARAATAREARW